MFGGKLFVYINLFTFEILYIFTCIYLFTVVTAFVTSQYAHEGVMTLPEKIQGAADDTNVYLKSTERGQWFLKI